MFDRVEGEDTRTEQIVNEGKSTGLTGWYTTIKKLSTQLEGGDRSGEATQYGNVKFN